MSTLTRVCSGDFGPLPCAADLPAAAERGRLVAGRVQRGDQRAVDLFQPVARRFAGKIGVVDPEAVQHQPVGQRVDLRRADFQPVAAQRPGELVEDARRDFFGRADRELHGRRVGPILAGGRGPAAGSQAVQQPQIGRHLLGRRGVQIAGRQGVDLPGEPRLRAAVAQARADLLAAAGQQFLGGGGRGCRRPGAASCGDRDRSTISAFQPSHTPGPTAARSAAVSTKSISSTSGEPTCTANRTTSLLVARVAAERQVVHQQVLVDQQADDLGLARAESQPRAGLRGDPQPDLAVVLQVPLAQVVDQQCQVQQPLLRQRAIHAAQRPGVGPQLGRALDRADAMLVDRVLVILVELQQPARVANSGINRSRMPASCRSRSNGPSRAG